MQMKSVLNIFKMLLIVIWLSLVFLIAINFLDRINELIRFFFIYNLFLVLFFRNNITFNLEFILLLVFGTTYYFIYIDYLGYTEWTYIRLWVGAPALYFIGKTFISKKTEKYYHLILYMFAFGLFFYGFMNMFLSQYIEGALTPGARVAYDIWGNHPIGATLMGVYFTSIGTLIIYNLLHLKIKSEWYLKILLFLGLGLSIYFSILLANRTFFIVLGLVFLMILFLDITRNKSEVFKSLGIVILFLTSIYLVYHFDVFGIQTFINGTRWFNRLTVLLEAGLLSDPRFKVYGLVYPQIFDYTLGGYQMDLGGLTHAHNMWMDTLYTAGIYPFFMLIAYSILTIITLIKFNLSKEISRKTKILASSIFLGMLLNFMVEPILEGVPYVFIQFCLINGATYQYLHIRKQKTNTE